MTSLSAEVDRISKQNLDLVSELSKIRALHAPASSDIRPASASKTAPVSYAQQITLEENVQEETVQEVRYTSIRQPAVTIRVRNPIGTQESIVSAMFHALIHNLMVSGHLRRITTNLSMLLVCFRFEESTYTKTLKWTCPIHLKAHPGSEALPVGTL